MQVGLASNMAAEQTSSTLPQNLPEAEANLPAGTVVNGVHSDGQSADQGALGKAFEKDGRTEKAPAVVKNKPRQATPDENVNNGPEYNFSEDYERECHRIISKAHASLRKNGKGYQADDKDEEIAKLAEMVSHMTHLLAASGFGRDKTARAMAYMAGPDQLLPNKAFAQARRDIRKKRANEGAGNTSRKSSANQQGGNTKLEDEECNKKSGSELSAGTKPSIDNATVSGDQTAAAADSKSRNEDAQKSAPSKSTASHPDKPKKRWGRRPWFGNRRNRNKKQQGKDDKATTPESGQEAPQQDMKGNANAGHDAGADKGDEKQTTERDTHANATAAPAA